MSRVLLLAALSSAFSLATSAAPAEPYGYTAREPDASGLVYYRARYYDSSLGRFTQRDPLGLGAGLNDYAYVGGKPVDTADPGGMDPSLAPQQGQATYWGAVRDFLLPNGSAEAADL